jgi:GntR family transcriptional regulator
MQGKKQPLKQTPVPEAIAHRDWDFEPLDKSSFTPMYFQIQTQLLKMIQSGRLRAGDSLPSEEELSRICGVSRMTSRQALQALKSQGYASRHKGQGSFVSQPLVEKDITHLCGFTAEMQALGIKASSRVLTAETAPAPAEIAAQFGRRECSGLLFAAVTASRQPPRSYRRNPPSVQSLSGSGRHRFLPLFALPDAAGAL